MMTQQKLFYYIPESLASNLKQFFIDNGYPHLAERLDEVNHFINKLYLTRVTDKRIKNENKFIELYSVHLRNMYGEDYKRNLIRPLIQMGIIETDGFFKSKALGSDDDKWIGYRIGEEYRHESFRRIPEFGSEFTEKIRKWKNSQFEGDDIKVRKRLLKDLQEVSIDAKAALNFIWDKFTTGNNILIDSELETDILEYLFNNITTGSTHIHKIFCFISDTFIEDINSFEIHKTIFNKSDSYLYNISLLTNYYLSYICREEEIRDEKPLHSDLIDDFLKSKFPREGYYWEDFLDDLKRISKIYHKDFFFHFDETGGRLHTNISNLSKHLRQFITIGGKKLVNLDIRNSQPLLLSVLIREFYKVRHIELPEDALQYIMLCEEGEFYEFLFPDISEENRKKKKQELFEKVFYGDLPKKKLSQLLKLFIKKFPGVWEVIKWEKRNNYADLAIRMQSIESNLIIWRAVKNIYKKNKDICLLTIHDSIVATEEHAELVKQELIEAFKSKNLFPSISTEKFTSEEEHIDDISADDVLCSESTSKSTEAPIVDLNNKRENQNTSYVLPQSEINEIHRNVDLFFEVVRQQQDEERNKPRKRQRSAA